MKKFIVIATMVMALLIPYVVPAQSGDHGSGEPKMTDGRGRAGDSGSLTDEQRASVKSILSRYNASTVTADDAKAIHRAFRDAGLKGGPGLNEAVTSAGFNSDKLRDLDPPPDKKNPKEGGGQNLKPDKQ